MIISDDFITAGQYLDEAEETFREMVSLARNMRTSIKNLVKRHRKLSIAQKGTDEQQTAAKLAAQKEIYELVNQYEELKTEINTRIQKAETEFLPLMQTLISDYTPEEQ